MYTNRVILAPMVRVCTLPMRLLALEYGADLVYSEELIDWKLLNTKRVENNVLHTIDYVDLNDGSIVFQTTAAERDKVILQMGTSDVERAVRVAKMVQQDVAAIDINMGCPKEFSIKGGMGVALLHNPEKAKSILKRLVAEVNIPITCKIRLLETERTIKLVQEFEEIGISAIGIHGRTKVERPQHPVHSDRIKEIAQSISIPVICNGGSRDIDKYEDIIKFRSLCGTTSVMVARSAQQNVSIFRKGGTLPVDDVIVAYLRKCIKYLHQPTKTKYCVQSMLRELQETPRGKRFLETQTLEQICEVFNLGEEYREMYRFYVSQGYTDIRAATVNSDNEHSPAVKKQKLDDFEKKCENIIFIRSNYNNTNELPKSVLFSYALKKCLRIPEYNTVQTKKLFRSSVCLNGRIYFSGYFEKNKKFAEQAAALSAMLDLGLVSREALINTGSLIV